MGAKGTTCGIIPRLSAPPPSMLTRHLIRLLWRTLALLALALGLLGVFVPGLPTVPFLLLSAWAAGRGWDALEAWLLNHPRYGSDIRRWRERGAVSRRAKWAASAMMALSAIVMWQLAVPLWAQVSAPLTMAGVGWWLWRRPET